LILQKRDPAEDLGLVSLFSRIYERLKGTVAIFGFVIDNVPYAIHVFVTSQMM